MAMKEMKKAAEQAEIPSGPILEEQLPLIALIKASAERAELTGGSEARVRALALSRREGEAKELSGGEVRVRKV